MAKQGKPGKSKSKSAPLSAKAKQVVVETETNGGVVVERKPLSEHITEVSDAITVLGLVTVHRVAMGGHGLTDQEVTAYTAQIELAKTVEGVGGTLSLDAVRQTVKTLAVAYRTAADLVCTSMTDHDDALATTLLCNGTFPDNDAALDKYLAKLAAPMTAYAGPLAVRGFSPEKQADFTDAIASFHAALAARPADHESLDAQVKNRQTVLALLLANTRYMRKVGHAATKGTPDHAVFDIPHQPRDAAQVAANRATAKAKRDGAKATKAAADAADKTAKAAAAKAKKAGKKKGKK